MSDWAEGSTQVVMPLRCQVSGFHAQTVGVLPWVPMSASQITFDWGPGTFNFPIGTGSEEVNIAWGQTFTLGIGATQDVYLNNGANLIYDVFPPNNVITFTRVHGLFFRGVNPTVPDTAIGQFRIGGGANPTSWPSVAATGQAPWGRNHWLYMGYNATAVFLAGPNGTTGVNCWQVIANLSERFSILNSGGVAGVRIDVLVVGRSA